MILRRVQPSVGARWVKRTLWRDVMDDPNVNDAEIVLVSLGAMDNQYAHKTHPPLQFHNERCLT